MTEFKYHEEVVEFFLDVVATYDGQKVHIHWWIYFNTGQ